ncbi:hypothetical protein R6Q59_012233 [Mikania micrantha]
MRMILLSQRVLYARAQDLSGGDSVYAAAQCRNYLSVDQCVVCFNVAFFKLAKCIVGNGAYVFLDECYVRYELFHNGLCHLATGDMLRATVAAKTPLGVKSKRGNRQCNLY